MINAASLPLHSQMVSTSQMDFESTNNSLHNSLMKSVHLEEESLSPSEKDSTTELTFNSVCDQLNSQSNTKKIYSSSKKSNFNKQRSLSSQPNNDFSSEIESGFIMCEDGNMEGSELLNKFDNISKNNISKNIIKAFFSYLLDTCNNDLLTDFVSKGVQVAQARKMAKNYFKSYSYNNNSLHKLIEHPKYGKAFEFYLTFEAEQWLSESKVQQKETHLVYIDFLKLCCSHPNFSDHIVTYKKNKKRRFNDRI